MITTSLLFSTNVQTNSAYALDYGYPISFFDLTMVFSGELHYSIDGKDVILKRNDVIFIPPGSMRIRYKGNEPVHYMSINFYSDGTNEASIPLHIPNCRSFFKESMVYFDRLVTNTAAHRKTAIDHGLRLLIELLKGELENRNSNRHVRQILEYISSHLTQPMTLDEIAANVHLSVPYCCHIVKKELGCTITEIITRERVELAKKHVEAKAFPLMEIPYQCGFNDYTNFYKCFKKHTGLSPSKYKP